MFAAVLLYGIVLEHGDQIRGAGPHGPKSRKGLFGESRSEVATPQPRSIMVDEEREGLLGALAITRPAHTRPFA